MRKLWHNKYSKLEELNKRHTFIGLSAGTIGTMALMGGGTAAALMANKKKKGEENQFQQYNPADYLQLKDLLYGIQEKGYPEMMQESYWGEPWRQTEQGIMEDLRAKRGLGVASTPEITQRQFAQSDLLSKLMGQNMNVRQNALNMLAGITPRPTTQYTPEGPSGLENLLSFGAPIASTALSGYLQGQNPMNKAMTKYLTSQITPKSPSSVYDYETDPNANLELLKLLPMLMGGM